MTPSKDLQDAAKLIQKGMDENSQPSPQLSIDPDTQKMAVVGDPNQIKPTNGDYTLTFLYSPDEIIGFMEKIINNSDEEVSEIIKALVK